MLTPTQQRRFNLYQDLGSLAKVAEKEGVSRESIRQSLESMPKESREYQDYKAIAQSKKGGRPQQYKDPKARRRKYMQQWRAARHSANA